MIARKTFGFLNEFSNSTYERCAEIETISDPEIEALVQSLSKAADDLASATHSLLEQD